MPSADLLRLGEHVMTVCNSCRYCEAYCPVFPAMEERLVFKPADLAYLANLCHNCGECLYACQYAPPHEFGINVPRTWLEAATLGLGVGSGMLGGTLFGVLAGVTLMAPKLDIVDQHVDGT